MQQRKGVSANKTADGRIRVFLNIKTWPAMQIIRQHLKRWLPDLPVWNALNPFVSKSYFRNTFRWDGEYVLYLPIESRKDVEALLLKQVNEGV